MEEGFATDERLRRYLLAELDEADRARVEAAYFDDDPMFERLGVVEDELIDAYVGGTLDAAERARFEAVFLTTSERRERVAFARTWRAAVDSGRASMAGTTAVTGTRASHAGARQTEAAGVLGWLRAGLGVPRWALVAPAAACLAGGLWLGIERTRLTDMNERLAAERAGVMDRARELQQQLDAERRRVEALQASQPSPARAGPAAAIATFVLTTGLVRDAAGGTVVRIAPGTALLRLRLELETSSHPRYRPVIETVDGEEVWRQRTVPAEAVGGRVTVTVELPASLLTNRDYILTLSGVTAAGRAEEVAAYAFRVAAS